MPKFFVTILSILITGTLYAQSRFSIGIEYGPVISTVGNYELIEVRPKAGTATGLSLIYDINEIFSIRSGFGSQRKGCRMSALFTDDQGSYTRSGHVNFNQDYLVVPLYGQMRIGKSRSTYLSAGPYVGILNRSFTKSNLVKEQPSNIEMFKKKDAGLSLGAGQNLPLTDFLQINLEVMYSHGLVDSFKNSIFHWYQRSLAVTVGLRYRFHD